MIEQLIYQDDELPSDVRCEILSFMWIEWPFIFRGENRFSKHVHSPSIHPVHIVLMKEGVLISYATVVWTLLEHASDVYKAYGLSNVFTYPTFRHEGYGTRVVQVATDYIRKSDTDIGILFCDSDLLSFYAKSGWVAVDAATLIGARSNPTTLNEPRMMLFISEKGEAAQQAFKDAPLYFGESWW